MESVFCGHKFPGKTRLKKHYRKHIKERPYLYSKCPTDLSTKCSLNYHPKTHIPRQEREMKCPLCEMTFLSKYNLKLHVSGHDGNKSFECKMCEKKLANQKSFRQHVNRHKNINAFACSTCPKAFNDKAHLQRHAEGVHGFERHKCHICGKMFSLKCYLNQHLKLHNPQRERFQCDKCPKSYLTKVLFEEHQLIHQEKDYSFQCDKCEQRFLTSRALKSHTSYYHLDKAHIFSCVFCKKQFPNFSKFQSHMFSHTLERPYLCKLCPAEYFEGKGVRLHYKRVHSKSRKHFECGMCSKSFLSKNSLNNHIRLHVGELHFECQNPGCGMRFGSANLQRRHFLKVHIGKQFFCTVCGKKFLTKFELQQHALVHTDFKGHQCQLCNATFKQRKTLIRHKRTMHSNK